MRSVNCGAEFLFFCLLSALPLAGCNQSNHQNDNAMPNLVFDWKMKPTPPRVGIADCTLSLRNAQGQPVKGATVKLEGNMSHPGMQPSMAKMKETSPGTYSAPLDLTMGGDWFVLIDATLSDGHVWHQQVNLPNVRSGK